MQQQQPETIKLSFHDDLPLAHFPRHGFQLLRRADSDPQLRQRVKQTSDASATITTTAAADHDSPSLEIRVGDRDDPNHNVKSGEEEEDAVASSRKGQGWGRGIVRDFQRTVGTWWIVEMTNLNIRTVAVTFFLFFACVAPAITFGALYSKFTHNWMGAVEMLAGTAWGGIFYALIGGQPMLINGGTGPVLVFTGIVYKMSEKTDVPFLTFNAWVGIWVFIYMIAAAITDLNRIIRYATRFTDEIFSLLIAAIFIVNAVLGITAYFKSTHHSHEPYIDDRDYYYLSTAFLSLMLCLGTVWLSFFLRGVKFSPFLPNQLCRNSITDFAVVASIMAWTLFGEYAFPDVATEKLNVPDHFAPTYACCTADCHTNWPDDCPDLDQPFGRRSWWVSLDDLNGKSWVPFMAAGPALLAFILVFLDDGITSHLCNEPEFKLTHGAARNYDTEIIGTMILVNSLIGLPWLVAATVRSLNHIHALSDKDIHGKILGVQETRLTHLAIHVLCLASIFALDVLKLIPVPVLYGVFLFMGLVALSSNAFWGRVLMLFMQPKLYPALPATQHLRPLRIHLFTIIQLALFGLLYVVKSIKMIAIAFPLVIAVCIPIRLHLLPLIFSEEELVLLDADDAEVEAWLAERAIPAKEEEEEAPHSEHEKLLTQGSEDADNEGLSDLSTMPRKGADAPMVEVESAGRRPRRRVKSSSCPPGMLFAPPPVAMPETIPEDEELAAPTEELSDEAPEEQPQGLDVLTGATDLGDQHPTNRPRRRRIKSVSCPPHMLFQEAERHVASNYFFG